jgi:hypothetical protein
MLQHPGKTLKRVVAASQLLNISVPFVNSLFPNDEHFNFFPLTAATDTIVLF